MKRADVTAVSFSGIEKFVTRSISSLTWADQSKADEPLAPYTVNYALDQTWQFTLPGTYQNLPVTPVGMIVDNSAFPGTTTVTVGPYQMTVLPYTRQPIDFSPDAQQVRLVGSNATDQPRIQFYLKKPIDLVQNQFAIYQAVQAQIAANFLGSMTPIINSEFKVWPDGGTRPSTAPGNYCAEGWMIGGPAGTSVATQQAGIITNASFSLDVQRTAASADVTAVGVGTALQSVDCQQFRGSKVTVSFDIYFGSTFSNPAGIFVSLIGGLGVDEKILTGANPGFTGFGIIKQIQIAPSVAVQRLSFTTDAALANVFTQLGLWFFYQPVGVAGVNDFWGISRVQFDIGDTAQAYRAVPDAFERDRCERFYEILNSEAVVGYVYGMGTTAAPPNSPTSFVSLTFKTKRALPAITFTAVGTYQLFLNGGPQAIAANAAVSIGLNRAVDQVTTGLLGAWGPVMLQDVGGNSRITINARM